MRKERKAAAQNVHERVRGFSAAEQMRCAREGELPERVALERVYGKAVWEALLENPRVTVPEIALAARQSSYPMPVRQAAKKLRSR